jgi:hypothetical protein
MGIFLAGLTEKSGTLTRNIACYGRQRGIKILCFSKKF